ncbi:MAG: tetratricopeptide repeat protein [Alphaproteobacteria bacterium]|nr:tetratricopeptide repeat protein [Alphaproteobacteria bacterium]
MAERMARLLAAGPEFGLAHCLRGYLAMHAFNAAQLGVAKDAAAAAERLTARANARERAHAVALRTWSDGDSGRAVQVWEDILAEYPRDILAFRLAHYVNFWRGLPALMLASVERVYPHWAADVPGFVSVLGCLCFAAEECGLYGPAEQAGREAIARDPGDLWAAHGVAHVFEMQGRRGEGLDWIAAHAPGWTGANNLAHHLWWHAAMYHLERRDFDQVLNLYDARIRDLESPLVQAVPDLYIDVQNAASMLFRLGRHGVDVGARWTELAEKAEARIGDTLSGFTLPHWMMALAATGRFEAAGRMLQAVHQSSDPTIRNIAAPVCQAVLAHGRGEYAQAVAAMRPVLGEMYRLGGSHAQQDVLEQLYLDSAMKADSTNDVRLLLERVGGRHPVSPHRRIGYALAASAWS